jgi:nucleotide-binding universal stress UspA family protein
MDTAIKNILMPVDLEPHSFLILEHAATFATANNATIHLLHINDHSLKAFLSKRGKKTKQDKIKLLAQWKQCIEDKYSICVVGVFKEGNVSSEVHSYACHAKVDLIMLGVKRLWTWSHILFESTAKKITRTSNLVPVFTILCTTQKLFHWQHIVIPVSNFIPEKRIRAILSLAMVNNIKLHFVTLPGRTKEEKFNVLLDSLKLVKLFGNITVECKILHGNNLIKAAWAYAENIDANAIIVNRNHKNKLPSKEIIHTNAYEAAFIKTFQPSF